MAYIPTPAPTIDSVDSLRRYLEEELKRIGEATQETTVLDLRPINAAPTRPREGMIVFADGTHWNPGAGKGVYNYSGGTWNKL